jgi:hypothetical protein
VAPRIWNITLHTYLIDELKMAQSEADPCYYYKVLYKDGTRLDLCVYVDDAWCYDDAGVLADANLDKLGSRFKIKLEDNPKHFLGMNVLVQSPSKVTLTSEAYILSMADKYIPGWRARGQVSVPATDALLKAYDEAVKREHTPTPAEIKVYGGKVGALIYTSPCVRVDACCAIGRLSRALTFPTPELEALADQTMLYLAQNATLALSASPSTGPCHRLM